MCKGGVNVGVAFFPLLRRMSLTLAAIICASYGTAFLGILIQQQLLRRRAERLLLDFEALRLEQTTFEQTVQFRARWAKWAKIETHDCTVRDCVFSVLLEDISVRHPTMFQKWWLSRLYGLVGGRPGRVSDRVGIKDSLVSSEEAGVITEAFDWSGQKYDLVGDIYGHIPHDQFNPHRDGPASYVVHQAANCGQCIFVEFGTQITDGDRRRLASFDLSCLVSLAACRTIDRLMPMAWSELVSKADAVCVSEGDGEIRRAWRVGVFEVAGVDADQFGERMNVKLEKVLRGNNEFRAGDTFWMYAQDTAPGQPIHRGTKLIVAFLDLHPKANENIDPAPCGTLLMNESNLQRVQRLIAEQDGETPSQK